MINIELNDQTAEDVKLINELKGLGLPEEYIQQLYDQEQARRKESKMSNVIVHRYVEPNLGKLERNENADCCKCMMAKKTPLLDGGEGYLCKAALYDIKTLACFVPKDCEG